MIELLQVGLRNAQPGEGGDRMKRTILLVLVVALVLVLAAAGGGWKWGHSNQKQAGWTWDDSAAMQVWVED
jgi:hypothetical protein